MKNKKVKLKISPKRFFCPKNRRGQFYLIAAIVIISVIIGFTSISNYSKKQDYEKVNDLKEELQIETGKVIEYSSSQGFLSLGWTYEEINNSVLKNISEIYINYSEIENLFFVLGGTDRDGSERLIFSGISKEIPEKVSINYGSGENFLNLTERNYTSLSFESSAENVAVNVDGTTHNFKLNPGTNLFFIITNKGYVASNK